jgi:hypothetical protein
VDRCVCVPGCVASRDGPVSAASPTVRAGVVLMATPAHAEWCEYPGMREARDRQLLRIVRPSGRKTRSSCTSCRASISRLTTETLALHAKG